MNTPQNTKVDRRWKFHPGAASPEMTRPDFDDRDWRVLDLPHDWAVEGAFAETNYLPRYLEEGHLEGHSDSYLPRGKGVYRRVLEIPELYPDEALFLEFEGVFGRSTLWADGQKAGVNSSGYAGKLFDLTDFARGKKTLALALDVDADDMQGWWYEGAGIYRHVRRIVKPACRLTPWETAVATPEIAANRAVIEVKTEIANGAKQSVSGELRYAVTSPEGLCAASGSKPFTRAAGACETMDFTCEVATPELWSPDRPKLYKLTLELVSGAGIDREEITFGIRFFAFTADRGFFLNGAPLQLRGGNLHHDYAGLGTALPDRAHEKNVEVLKAMGCNMIRSSHNPAAPALMEACDRLGMLLWTETRNLHLDRDAEEDLANLIRRDRNHPCVVVRGLANIGGARNGSTRLTEPLKVLHQTARKLDGTRPTAVALEANADANASGFACVTDVVGYNGGGMGIDDRDHRLYPERRMMISEYGSGRGARGVYEEIISPDTPLETLGDGRTMPRGGHYASTFDLCAAHEREWTHVKLRGHLAGGLMWSAIEYRGETTGWPIVTSQFGPLDFCRFPKDNYYYYLKEWTKQPVLHIFPHWTHPGREGQIIDIWSYSNCDYIDLELNGHPLHGWPRHLQYGSSRPHLEWSVPYEPGRLVARGWIDGKVVVERELRTAGAPAAVAATPDRPRFRADGEDLVFVRLDICDAAGTIVPEAANLLKFEVSGAGKLLGAASGDPGSHESDRAPEVHAFKGSALAIIQSDGTAGTVRFEAASPGLRPIVLEFIAG